MGLSKVTVRRQRLGAELRRLRELAGMSADAAALRLERSASTISRVENGKVRAHPREVEDMLRVYGVDDAATRAALVALARDGRKRGWWHSYRDVLSDPYADFISLEADASDIRSYESTLVPGLVQTADYARQVIANVPAPACGRDVEKLVAVRIERQKRLSGSSPVSFWAVLDESVLRRVIGGRHVMQSQLEHLAEMSTHDHVTVQVLPFSAGAHAGVNGAFTMLGFSAILGFEVVLTENLTSSLYIEAEDEIRRYAGVFDHLRMTALSEADSRAMILQAAKEL